VPNRRCVPPSSALRGRNPSLVQVSRYLPQRVASCPRALDAPYDSLRQRRRTPEPDPARALDRERFLCSLRDQPALELAEDRNHVRHRLAARGRGVDGAVERDQRPVLLLRRRHQGGEAMAHVLATFRQFERRLISQRTKEALAVKKAKGVRLGRPPTVPQKVVRRIQRQRARGEGSWSVRVWPVLA
jgi:Resolvase, N terminal domain